MMMDYIIGAGVLGGLILVGIIILLVLLFQQSGERKALYAEALREAQEMAEEVARLSTELDVTQDELARTEERAKATEARLNTEIGGLKSERDKLSENNKMQFVRNEQLKNELQTERTKATEANQKIIKLVEKETQNEKTVAQKMEQMHEAQKAFHHEKERLRVAADERAASEYANKQRLWDDHEKRVVADCAGICAEPDLRLPMKDNTNPPDGFGTLKPDAAVWVLNKWLVIDAKSTTASREGSNMVAYLKQQAQATAAKYASIADVHNAVYFVVPSTELEALHTRHWREGTFDFYAISVAGISPLLRSWKRMEQYAELTDIDPEERETIVDLIARYQQHIDVRNAVELHLMAHNDEIAALHGGLSDDFQHDLKTRRTLMSQIKVPTTRALNTAAKDYATQKTARDAMVKPQPLITPQATREAQKLL